MNTVTVILIRHAQSQLNTNRQLIGGRSTASPLSERGVEQATQLGRYLHRQQIHPAKVYSSPAVRTMQTARLSLSEDAPDIHLSQEIHEMSQGMFEGRLRDEVYTADVVASINAFGKDFALPDSDAESMNDVAHRMDTFLQQVASEAGDGDTIVVYTHGIAICCYIATLQGLDQQQVFALSQTLPNASLTTLRFTDAHQPPDVIAIGKVFDIDLV